MQWIPNDEHKRRDESFAAFIGGVAYEEDRGWSKEVWDAAWSARGEWVGLDVKYKKREAIEETEGISLISIEHPVGQKADGDINPDSLEEIEIDLPEREWVGLTDEDIKEIIGYHGDLNANGYARQLFAKIEAKLREKNGC